MDMELIINTLDGWAPTTRLYRVGLQHYIIQCLDVASVQAMMARRIPEGIEKPTTIPALPGPTSVFRADLVRTPIMSWISDRPGQEPPAERLTVEQTDTEVTFLVNGVRWGGMRQEQTGETFTVTAIDDNDDPLDGLTPWAVLGPGTTFEQALDHIAAHVVT
ncbi:hypothetical protein [Gordonia sp. SL306]|uniref:hypothetical protein n=1 Tax=Gordonia sp. SL306 TaxID=2995145 RepID=UPI00226E22B1|nr:hypothetical protein [Gordonia sp. SL306]WAC54968.1 hypothetical protein OVA31_20375 [Gordonia sp. SL306]